MRAAFAQKFIDWFRGPDLAIDLGTANTRLFARGRGLLADVPTNVADSTESTAPLTGGVVTDISGAGRLLKQVVDRARDFGSRPPRAIACAPTDVSATELAALVTAVRCAGVSSVKVIPEPLAGAVGAGLDISSKYAHAVIDLGAGVTDIAVIRSGIIVHQDAVRIGYSDLISAVQWMTYHRYGIVLDREQAESLTQEVASIDWQRSATAASEVDALDWKSGRYKRVEISGEDVSHAIQPIIDQIMEAVRSSIRRLPPLESAEVIESGICITGGGACLPGIKERIAGETSHEVNVAPDPLHAVINGASQMLMVGAQTGMWNRPGL